MLRMRFMPCDFRPLLLILGSHDEIRHVADLLETFAQSGRSVDLNAQGIFSEDTYVRLVALGAENAGKPGLWRDKGPNFSLTWTLTPDQAETFAEEVAKVAGGTSRAGSTDLECEILHEIKVKVSLGEFEDEFLLGDAR